MRGDGRSPTTREIAEALDPPVCVQAVGAKLQVLKRKGVVERAAGYRSYQLTDDGRDVLGLRKPAANEDTEAQG